MGDVMVDQGESVLQRVSVTDARNLSPLFDRAVREQQPVEIVRHQRDSAVLVEHEQFRRLLDSYEFHVDVIPEDEGFTLWIRELEIGESGPTIRDARTKLLRVARAYAADYLNHLAVYRHFPDLAPREPYVMRVALTRDDRELREALLGAADAISDET
jgi:hypothetical protein